ncbi:MAG TPA: hypothetical protein VK662_15915 [Acidothermaceae bacterium]|jgi:hypothetical protein|nr:hypothetical protein [Acidothermaceae bacterium]
MKVQMMAVLVACSLLAAACAHSSRAPGVASVPSPTQLASSTGSASSTGNAGSSAPAHNEALAYASCMRGHGISDFPDPDSSGQIDLKGAALQGGPNSDLNGTSPQFQAASTACKSLQPTESTAQQHQDATRALMWARCMRTHGITNFPDPDSGGGFHVAAIRADGVDVTTPRFQAAATACEQYQPSDIRVPGGSGAP